MTPTIEQDAIIKAVLETGDSILINALAGAAKTTTLELIAKALPTLPILCLAFNKKTAEEMERRLPSNVRSQTMNSIGHRVWGAFRGRRLVVNTRKSYEILKSFVDDLRGSDKKEAYEVFADTLKVIQSAKLNGYLPEGKFGTIPRLVQLEDFFSSFEDPPSPLQIELLDKVMLASIKQSFDGAIDFDDQILMPTLFGGDWPTFPLVLIDEAQDLSPLNHVMLDRLVTKRIIAVGDENQSIYGFRGAVTDSMEQLKTRFSMTSLPLSISFRCPQEVVKLVRKHTPTMQWPEWAIEGIVGILESWSEADVPDNSAIICRNNAPLLRMALALLKVGRGVKLVGTDLGPGLIKTLKKLGSESMSREQTLIAIQTWEVERLRKSKAKSSIEDKADCLRVFAAFGDTLGAAIAYAEHLFATSGPIQLLSGHKAKGLEYDIVFHLDSWRIPSKWATTDDDLRQEQNILYVVNTRARKELYFVDTERFVHDRPAPTNQAL